MKLNTVKTLVKAAVKSGSEETLHELVDWAMANPVPEEAVVVLEIFDVLQSTEALLQLQMLAYSRSSPELVSGARQKMEEIAQSRGIRVWELEDLIVPKCGLESEDHYPFEIQGVPCQLRLNTQLEPYFVDAAGNALLPETTLPPEIQKVIDDLSDVLPTQILRLEMALGTEQRWRVRHWREKVLGHPVLIHLVQRLIWGTFSDSGRIQQTFRVSEEEEICDVNDKPIQIEEGHFIGILHPLNVAPDILSGWNATLADYEIPTLCPQLDRPIFAYDPDSPKAESLTLGREDFGENGLLMTRVISGLLSRGWRLTSSYHWMTYEKTFREADVQAKVQLNQRDEIAVSANLVFQRFLGYPRHSFQFRDVNPIVYSEAVLDVKQATR